jgi:hypothetical protein
VIEYYCRKKSQKTRYLKVAGFGFMTLRIYGIFFKTPTNVLFFSSSILIFPVNWMKGRKLQVNGEYFFDEEFNTGETKQIAVRCRVLWSP